MGEKADFKPHNNPNPVPIRPNDDDEKPEVTETKFEIKLLKVKEKFKTL